MTKKILLVLVLLQLFYFLKGQADTSQVDLFDLSLEELMDLDVVSSSKSAEKVNVAPNVITVFGADYIKSFNWTSINDVLYKHTGFFPSQDYDRRTVGYRGNFEGWNNNHLLMLVDGVPFNDNLYGTAYTWEITPLIFTKTLEVIRGPGAALYGTNATNGVITMNTISYKDFGGKKAFISARYGEKNTHMYDVVTGFRTKLFSNVTSLSFHKTDGEEYLTYDDALNTQGITTKFETKDNHYGGYFFTKFEGEDKLKGFSLQYHFQLWDYETGHGWLFEIPDNDESMQEYRSIVVLKYQNDINEKLSHEFVLRHQLHAIDWDMYYYRTGAFVDWYPNSVNEYLKSSAQDIFARVQYAYKLPKESKILGAAEYTTFFYNGDNEHYSNTDLNDELGLGYAPFPNGENRAMGPWFEYIKGKYVNNLGSFLQFTSGKLFGDFIRVTAGLRYDTEFFKYTDIYDPNLTDKNKNYNELSPRLVLLFMPMKKLTIKLIGGNAFRAPTPTEMFGTNTWTLASNLAELEAERVQTGEIAFDYQVTDQLVARLNGFYNKFTGQIAYSLGNNNLSTNIYDLTNIGMEGEVVYTSKQFLVFGNFSYTKRTDEEIFEAEQPYISVHPDRLTWAPRITSNLGISYLNKGLSVSLSAHYQGEVLRRYLDLYSANDIAALGFTESPRPDKIENWVSMDAKVSYKIKFIEFGLSGTNILDSENYLAKNLKYPFDYKMPGRRIMFNTVISF